MLAKVYAGGLGSTRSEANFARCAQNFAEATRGTQKLNAARYAPQLEKTEQPSKLGIRSQILFVELGDLN